MEKPTVHKLWLSTDLHAAVQELAWRERKRVSPLVIECLREFVADPEAIIDDPNLPSTTLAISIYVRSSEWNAAAEVAESVGIRIGDALRRVLVARIRLAGILAETGG